jgi:hypothetical protein
MDASFQISVGSHEPETAYEFQRECRTSALRRRDQDAEHLDRVAMRVYAIEDSVPKSRRPRWPALMGAFKCDVCPQ